MARHCQAFAPGVVRRGGPRPHDEGQEAVRSASVSLAFWNFGVRDENRRQDAGVTYTLGGCVPDNGAALPSIGAGSAAADPYEGKTFREGAGGSSQVSRSVAQLIYGK